MNSPKITELTNRLEGKERQQLKWALSAKLTPEEIALLDRALSLNPQQQEHGGLGDK